MRKVSPLRYATKNETDALYCKKIERILLVITVAVLFAIYKRYEGLESVLRMFIVFLIAQPIVYFLMWFPKQNLEKFNSNKHGDIIY